MDKIESDYRTAKATYDEAERVFAEARYALRIAEEARNRSWKELVNAAESIPDDMGRKLAAEQWGSPLPSTRGEAPR